MGSQSSGPLRSVMALAVAGSVYRSARTVARTRAVVPLAPAASDTPLPPPVTIVVPARDEAGVLHECLKGLRAQTHPGTLRIVLVDDGSTDGTGDIGRAHAAVDPRVRVVRVEGPPPGWAGKVHAMHVGIERAGAADAGEWLLFVDADTVLEPELLGRLIATAESVDADLVSTPGGPPAGHSASWPLLMPAGLQMIGENASPDGRGRKAFAIGHCLALRRSYYEKIGGWRALASMRNEDVAIATAVRDHGGTTRLVDGVDHVTTSGMDPFVQGWASFRKSFVAGAGGSAPVLLAGGLGQIALSLAPPVATLAGLRGRHPALAAVGLAGWAAQGVAHARTAKLMRADSRVAPLAPLTGALFGGVLLDGAARVVRGTVRWKGRRTTS
ncbi:glycosyltransferase [Saccharopolyspora erythraea]|uniref:glycosyltransferase n=1 Tax=Saccharopolyspora erythraea TaxID=1836 RepID=UPI002013A85F|nr:glycosyltransferase family 2 protein [Saccharopolyspora erythraea]